MVHDRCRRVCCVGCGDGFCGATVRWSRCVATGFLAPVVTPVPVAIEKSAALASIQRWLPGKPSEAADTKPREIVLQGAFVVAGQARAALSLVSAVGLPPQRVKAVVGDVVEGWTILAIDKRKVVLRRGEESREIWMFRRR